MAQIPAPLNSTANMIYADYERNADSGHRQHLGASIIGHHCTRHLWYVFRHAESKKFPGRMLRLFDTGKREEARIIAELKAIGCDVFADDGSSQYRVSAIGGHFAGSMDAVLHGYHEAPTQYIVCEMKTHNAKSYKELVDKRVQAAKPMHYAQMQVYMGLTGMTRALYFAVNKDTDEIYTEYLHFDKDEFDRLFKRAASIINASEPPLRISEDQTFYLCKFCDSFDICHGTQAPEVNCRTCAHSTPDIQDGGWLCAKHGDVVQTCSDHRYIPILLEKFAEMTDANEKENWVMYRNRITGTEFYNGDLSSEEIRACQDKKALGDAGVQDIRHTLSAKVAV